MLIPITTEEYNSDLQQELMLLDLYVEQYNEGHNEFNDTELPF